jgi:hypothetical protein
MDTLFVELEAIIPTFLAVMSVVLFTPKTRWFSYAIVLLAIGAELIPLAVNMTALLACVSCFFGLLVKEFMVTHNLEKQIFQKHHS